MQSIWYSGIVDMSSVAGDRDDNGGCVGGRTVTKAKVVEYFHSHDRTLAPKRVTESRIVMWQRQAKLPLKRHHISIARIVRQLGNFFSNPLTT
jgi:hypothetical protein